MIEAILLLRFSTYSHRLLYTVIFYSFSCAMLSSQSGDCNRLGVWLWRFENTGFENHASLSDSLSNMGVKRIYVKVADGSVDSTRWPEIVDHSLLRAYHNNDMEVWAWSYNYPGNTIAQADALRLAAETGYDGYVIDIEMQFDNASTTLIDLMEAFSETQSDVTREGIVPDNFPLAVTTWGNPADHSFRIDILDRYVDAYFPQTYLENWGASYLDNPAFWVEVVNREYAELGATKPIHHIISTERNIISGDQLNAFIQYAGPETSIWRIPGGGTTPAIWRDWAEVDWDYNFCEVSTTVEVNKNQIIVVPNPVTELITIKNPNDMSITAYQLTDYLGRMVLHDTINVKNIDMTNLESGNYILQLRTTTGILTYKIIKI